MIQSIFILELLASIISFTSKNRHRDTYNISKVLLYTALIITACNLFIAHLGNAVQLNVLYYAGIQFKLMFKFDYLASMMLTVVLSISLIIYQYAERYLESDITRARFLAQLCLITLSVSILVLSQNLLTAFVGWQFIGIALYITLNHYHFDPHANRSSKKKFVINRVGDMCFLAAVILCYRYFGQSAYSVLYQQADTGLIGLLVFVAIMTKSAQFPFHIWLPDTMEAPTPVSALMHAGVINSGGYLLARLAPMYVDHTVLMYFISLVGLTTALTGSLFMLYQYDTKKRLAYSTMGQMGYMILQCGLGAFASAVFHLITHGFYKASLFLNAGATLKPQQTEARQSSANMILAAVLSAVLMVVGISFAHSQGLSLPVLVWFFIASAVLELVMANGARPVSPQVKWLNMVVITLVLGVYLTLLAAFVQFLSSLDVGLQLSVWVQYVVGGVILFAQLGYAWLRDYKFKLHWRLKLLLVNKLYVESVLRLCCLNPLRTIGDAIIQGFHLFKPWSYGLVLGVLAILALSLSWLTVSVTVIVNISIMVVLLLMLVTVTAANRGQWLASIVGWLGLFELGMISLAFVSDGMGVTTIGLYHLLNMGTLLGVLSMLISYQGTAGAINTPYYQSNRLGWRKVYVATLLILMLGVPGTAAFVTEYYILASLIASHVVYALLFGVAMIILSISILHCLQLYIFDQNPLYDNQTQLPVTMHALSWLVIAINLVSGIHPIVAISLVEGLL